MKLDLTGKTALVTASTGGIGFAIVRGLLDCGSNVIITGRSDSSVEHAKAALFREFPDANISAVIADFSSESGCTSVINQVKDVDILVNNAGIYGPQDFYETDDEKWNEFWETNVMSGVKLARAFTPQMVEKKWGRVVFISSESARNIPADMIHYGVSKTAQLSLSRGLAKRLAGTGVTVNAVLPGPTLSSGFKDMFPDLNGDELLAAAKDFVMTQRPSSVIQRAASTDEVANMVVYVCSPLSSATSGAALRVDGGVVDDIV
ncbi:SDR family NAD(P)-dependent oxidoreductase [Vibrio viridaestus]|uniref:SDR family oxidoreductase n=1 Tax=Vibrio viridaestus TaxID=2487322 RepID=A0A3N9TKV7_9VIBR|nr:SDR family oxidoreductase [Vibrio viridaestus]RQW64614.1 SDR family oxidoreductase [Vibrio viridaestus]